jgi:hypothetical protein
MIDAGRLDTYDVRRPLVITQCTSRKTVPPQLLAANLAAGPQAEIARTWLSAVSDAQPSRRAGALYSGTAFSKAKKTAAMLGADLAIVSAGLGILDDDIPVPSYDLTLSRGGIGALVSDDFDPRSWWSAISKGRYSRTLEDDLPFRPMVFACLSRAYVPLMAPLLELASQTRLRIFGMGLEAILPASLRTYVLPYDERLGVWGATGTRIDFAQRAMLHYATSIHPSSSFNIEEDKASVRLTFANTAKPMPSVKRASADDSTIRAIIHGLLATMGPRRTAMLRYLRDCELLACEQGRFARLYSEVRGAWLK